MRQLWHKAKALFGFGPEQEPEATFVPDESYNRLAVMAQPVVTEDTYRHRTDWSTRD